MSVWTHVFGALRFNGEPYAYRNSANGKDITKAYLPAPDEQMELRTPVISSNVEGGYDVDFGVVIHALPACKAYFDKALRMLPHGESSVIGHCLFNDGKYDCSSSDFECQHELDVFNKKLKKRNGGLIDMLGADGDVSYGVSGVEYVNHMTLAISDDVRHCDGVSFLKALMSAIAYLSSRGIDVSGGCLEWYDDSQRDRVYSFRSTGLDTYSYMVLDAKTNEVIERESVSWDVATDEDGCEYITHGYDKTPGWDALIGRRSAGAGE